MLNELRYNVSDFDRVDEEDGILVFKGNVYPIFTTDTSEENIQYVLNILRELCKVYDGLYGNFFEEDGTLKDYLRNKPINLLGIIEGNFENLPKLLYGRVTVHNDRYSLAFDYSMYDVANSQEFKQLMKSDIVDQFSYILLNDKAYTLEEIRNGEFENKKETNTNITPRLYHGTTTNYLYSILTKGLRQVEENSKFKVVNSGYVYLTSVYETAHDYAMGYVREKGGEECIIVVDTNKINKNNIVLDYDFANEYTTDIDNSPYKGRIKPKNSYYKGNVANNASNSGTKYGKIGYKGIIMPNAILGAYLYENNKRVFYDKSQLLYIYRPLESKNTNNRNMLKEYTSRFYKGQSNFKIKAYHTARRDTIYEIFRDGYLDAKAEHMGECPYDIIWFTIKNDDYDGLFRFSFEIDENTFKEMDFRWMNDIHLATPYNIDIMDKRLRIEKINGTSVDELFERFYNKSSKDPVGEFIEHAFQLTDYEISNELFVMKLLQQYGFKRSDWFGDDESLEMDESIIKEKQNNVTYYGVFLDDNSKKKLTQLLPKNYYKVFCDHMTIAFKTQFTDEIVDYCNSLLGENIEMIATHIGKNEDVMAVKVETECNSANNTKHITICTLSENGKPVQSNDITNWIKLKTPIKLNGVVKSYPFTVKEDKKYVTQGIIPYGDGEMCIGESEEQLNEVEASNISLKSFEVQDELNPKFWINNKINSRVRLKLLDIADEFIESLAVDWVKPKDIVITGSIANYNWSKYSDVDVHILIDFKEVWKKTEFVQDYFDSKKALWAQEHEQLKIYGFPVEMYVEDTNGDNPSSGIYSLNKNKWIVEPNDFQDAQLNEPFIKDKAAKIMTEIDDIDEKIKKETDNHKLEVLSTKLKKLFDKLHKQRQESLNKNGEMGTYNIIWKVLRRSGHLDKIWEIINTVYNKVNSIK